MVVSPAEDGCDADDETCVASAGEAGSVGRGDSGGADGSGCCVCVCVCVCGVYIASFVGYP